MHTNLRKRNSNGKINSQYHQDLELESTHSTSFSYFIQKKITYTATQKFTGSESNKTHVIQDDFDTNDLVLEEYVTHVLK